VQRGLSRNNRGKEGRGKKRKKKYWAGDQKKSVQGDKGKHHLCKQTMNRGPDFPGFSLLGKGDPLPADHGGEAEIKGESKKKREGFSLQGLRTGQCYISSVFKKIRE